MSEEYVEVPANIIPSSFTFGTELPQDVKITPYGVVGLPDVDAESVEGGEVPPPMSDAQLNKIWKSTVQGMIGLRDMADNAFKWTLGDLANFTTKRFSNGRLGELCEEHGVSSSVARDCARLARQYDFSQRTEASWSLHRVAAPLEAVPRAKLLAESIADGLTVEDVQIEADRIAGKGKGKRPGTKKAADTTEIKLTEGLFTRLHERIILTEAVDNTLDAMIDALPAHELEVKESGEGQSLKSEVNQLRDALKEEAKHLLSVASRLQAAVKLPKGAKRRVLVDNTEDEPSDHVQPMGVA